MLLTKEICARTTEPADPDSWKVELLMSRIRITFFFIIVGLATFLTFEVYQTSSSAEQIPDQTFPTEQIPSNSRLSVALAVSGTLRFWKLSAPSIRKNIIQVNPQVTFRTFMYVEQRLDVPFGGELVDKQLAESHYQPTVIEWLNGSVGFASRSTTGQLLKLGKNFKQVRDYEKKHNMTFDLVIRLRGDALFASPLNLTLYFEVFNASCYGGELTSDTITLVQNLRNEFGFNSLVYDHLYHPFDQSAGINSPPWHNESFELWRGEQRALSLLPADQDWTSHEPRGCIAARVRIVKNSMRNWETLARYYMITKNISITKYKNATMWFDHLWVMDSLANRLFAYHLETIKAPSGEEAKLLRNPGSPQPEGTLASIVYAYNMTRQIAQLPGFTLHTTLGHFWKYNSFTKDIWFSFEFSWMPPCLFYETYHHGLLNQFNDHECCAHWGWSEDNYTQWLQRHPGIYSTMTGEGTEAHNAWIKSIPKDLLALWATWRNACEDPNKNTSTFILMLYNSTPRM